MDALLKVLMPLAEFLLGVIFGWIAHTIYVKKGIRFNIKVDKIVHSFLFLIITVPWAIATLRASLDSTGVIEFPPTDLNILFGAIAASTFGKFKETLFDLVSIYSPKINGRKSDKK